MSKSHLCWSILIPHPANIASHPDSILTLILPHPATRQTYATPAKKEAVYQLTIQRHVGQDLRAEGPGKARLTLSCRSRHPPCSLPPPCTLRSRLHKHTCLFPPAFTIAIIMFSDAINGNSWRMWRSITCRAKKPQEMVKKGSVRCLLRCPFVCFVCLFPWLSKNWIIKT